jgi:hypothetical protein
MSRKDHGTFPAKGQQVFSAHFLADVDTATGLRSWNVVNWTDSTPTTVEME